MCYFRLFQNLETKPAIDKYDFDCLYDKYGSAIYGVLLKVVDCDTILAEKLLTEVFVEAFSQKKFNNETDKLSFIQLVKIIITVSGRHGYSSSVVMKIVSPPSALSV
jgi:hypothetical protein